MNIKRERRDKENQNNVSCFLETIHSIDIFQTIMFHLTCQKLSKDHAVQLISSENHDSSLL